MSHQKRNNIFVLLSAWLVIGSSSLYAQIGEEEKQNIIEQRIEAIAGSLDEGQSIDYTSLLEDLTYRFEHPLDLNTATAEDLRELNLLSDIQISFLLQHIAKYGALKSKFELQAVKGFDANTIRLIEPFVTIGAPGLLKDFSFKRIFSEGSSDLFLRYQRTLQQQEGFKPDPENNNKPAFLGSPNYFYTRYRFMYRKNIIAGFTLEKDAGESFQNGPDFSSAHLFVRNKTFVRTIALGDYQAQFGQGLTFWNGLGFGKSPFVMNVKKNAVGLKPYTSVNEALYLRGAATTFGWKRFELTALVSQKKMSANLVQSADSLAIDDGYVVSSVISSGLHRTEAELADKNALTEQIVGGNLKYSKGTFNMGFTAVHQQFSKSLDRNNNLYELYRFSGKENRTMGFDYQGVLKNANFFGEVSRSLNGGFATLNGMVASIHPRLAISAVQRYINKDYQSIYSNVFAEGNNLIPSNERGLFVGMQSNFAKGWTLSAYNDVVNFPWLKFRNQRPGNFNDYLAQLNYKPDKKHEFYFRYRVRHTSEDGAPSEAIIDYPVARKQQNFRLNAIYQVHPNVQMRTRAEWNIYEKDGLPRDKGFMFYQDVIYDKMGSPFSLNFRYALFESTGWNGRVYAYESDVLYKFTIPPYYGKGSRMYLLAKYSLTRGVSLWVKVGTWVYTDRNVISSGNSAIAGNTRTDFTAQLRWQF